MRPMFFCHSPRLIHFEARNFAPEITDDPMCNVCLKVLAAPLNAEQADAITAKLLKWLNAAPSADACRECGGTGRIESDSSMNVRSRPCPSCRPRADAAPAAASASEPVLSDGRIAETMNESVEAATRINWLAAEHLGRIFGEKEKAEVQRIIDDARRQAASERISDADLERIAVVEEPDLPPKPRWAKVTWRGGHIEWATALGRIPETAQSHARSDVSEAAERRRRNESPHYIQGGQSMEDADTLADAYLAEHDPTPIDRAFLKSCGATIKTYGRSKWRAEFFWGEDWTATIVEDGVLLVNDGATDGGITWPLSVKTRGQWRTIAAALGITSPQEAIDG